MNFKTHLIIIVAGIIWSYLIIVGSMGGTGDNWLTAYTLFLPAIPYRWYVQIFLEPSLRTRIPFDIQLISIVCAYILYFIGSTLIKTFRKNYS